MKYNLLIFAVIIIGFWAMIISFVTISSIPESPLKPSLKTANSVKYYFPQGWGFFTKNPRESVIYLYKKSGENWQNFQTPNSSPIYFFGLDKSSRAMGVEYGRILSNIRTDWVSFKGWDNCFQIADTLQAIEFVNKENKPLLKGEFILIAHEPIPFAWRNTFDKKNLTGQVIKINSICEKH